MNAKSLIWSKWVLILLLLAIAGGSGYVYWQKNQQKTELNRYRTVKLERGDITQTVSANGTLNPVVLVSVGTQVSGTVKKLYVDFNDKVTKGQVLMELDPALYQAQAMQNEANVRNAQASLDLAQANETRMKSLLDLEYISRQEYDQSMQALKSSKAQLDLARAQLQKDRTNLSYTIIRAPVSGVVVSRLVDIGQTVAASFQTPELFKIAQDLKQMQIDSSFAEADIGKIQVGQLVSFTVDAFAGRTFSGAVRQVRLNPTTLQNVVTYNVVVGVDNPEQILLPGMTAYVNIAVAKSSNALLIPNAALRFRPKDAEQKNGVKRRKNSGEGPSATVYVLENGQPKKVLIKTGISDTRMTEVISGEISTDDSVIVEDTSNIATQSGGAPGGVGSMRMRMF